MNTKANVVEDDDRYNARICEHCGCELEWAECHMIDCEDGMYDLGEEDCINYDLGTYVKCRECDGEGGHWYCPNAKCKPEKKA